MYSLVSSSTSHLMESEELKSRTGKDAAVSVSGKVSLSFFPMSSPPAHQLGLIKSCLWTNMYLSACSCFCKLNDFGETFLWHSAKLEQIACGSQDTPWQYYGKKWITQWTVILWDYYESCILGFFFFNSGSLILGTHLVPNKLMFFFSYTNG